MSKVRRHAGARTCIAFVCLMVAALISGASTLRAADSLPAQLTDVAFWQMVSEFSERGGYFSFQFMSNEREFPSVISGLKKSIRPGGVYLGVGPEQNFTYIAAVQPKIAFILDIRRQNLVEHLIYKVLFERSANRADFVSRLFSRRTPPGLNDKSTVRTLFEAYGAAAPDLQLFAQNLQAIKDGLMKDHGFRLTTRDQADIESIYRTVFDEGPGADNPAGNVIYTELMTAADAQGQAWSYLATEENFKFVREMERKNLIVPLVGDFAGTKAIRAIGDYLKEHEAVVTTFYTSNVEQYLFQQLNDWRRFYQNVATLPLDSSSTFIRSSHFAYDNNTERSRQIIGTGYVMLLCPMTDLVKAFNEGQIGSYDHIIRMSRE